MRLPASAKAPRLRKIHAGDELYRNHHINYPGARFNPCLGAETRFAPLRTDAGDCIPTLYAATTFDGAAYETILRGTPSRYAAIPRQSLDQRGVSRITPRRSLALVPLFTPEIKGLGLDPEAFFACDGSICPFCCTLAQQCWADNPTADGLIWTSIRDSASMALLLFGDRVAAADFDHLEQRSIASDPSLLDDFVEAAARVGFRISR